VVTCVLTRSSLLVIVFHHFNHSVGKGQGAPAAAAGQLDAAASSRSRTIDPGTILCFYLAS
jgi:hypothetical protein